MMSILIPLKIIAASSCIMDNGYHLDSLQGHCRIARVHVTWLHGQPYSITMHCHQCVMDAYGSYMNTF